MPLIGGIVIAILVAGLIAVGILYAGAKHATSKDRAGTAAQTQALAAAQAQLASELGTLKADQTINTLLGPTVKGMEQFTKGLDDLILAGNGNVTDKQAADAFAEVIGGLGAVRAALQQVSVPAGQQAQLTALQNAVTREIAVQGQALVAFAGNNQSQQDSVASSQVAALQGLAAAFAAPINALTGH